MKERVLVPEQMDDPNLDRERHIHALRGLQRINSCTRNAALVWRPIRELFRQLDTKRLRILDIATGAGDIPIQLWKNSRRDGFVLEIDASDVSETALEFAAENCRNAQVEVRLFPLDVLRNSIEQKYDLVMCSQFLHHFDTPQTETIIRKMCCLAEHRVVIVDLVRSRMNWLLVWLAVKALTRSSIVHFDGPQSIRAAYTPNEMYDLARRAGLTQFTIRTHWPCRFVLVGQVDSTIREAI